MVRQRIISAAVITSFCILGLTIGKGVWAQQLIAIATANPGSIYHSSGSAIAKVGSEAAGLNVTIQPFGGSSQYMSAVAAGELDFGLANVLEASVAALGEQHFEGRPNPDLRAVAILYPIRTGVFVRADSQAQTIADLKGLRAPSGFTSQKVIQTVLDAVYATADLTSADMESVPVPNIVGSADAFVAGDVDFFPFAVGAAKVKEVDAAVGGVRALAVEDTAEGVAAMQAIVPVSYLRMENPSPVATGIDQPKLQMAYDALIFASTQTPDDIVRPMVEALHENKKALAEAVPLFNLFDPDRMAVEVHGVEYHPAAQAFYESIGQWPPSAH